MLLVEWCGLTALTGAVWWQLTGLTINRIGQQHSLFLGQCCTCCAAACLEPQGMLGISRKGGLVSDFLQVGSAPPAVFKPLPMATGPVLLGVQMLYGFNFSATISKLSISYGSKGPFTRPSLTPPAPPPPPPPPPPPMCEASPAQPVTYPGGYQVMGVGGGGAMSCLCMSPYNDLWLVGTDM